MNNTQRQTRVRQLEQELQRKLLSYYRKIKPELAQTTDFNTIKRKYERQVYDTIRQSVQQVHSLGIEYVGQKLNQTVFVTETDVQTIKQETDDLSALFWKRINKDFERERDRDFVIGILKDPLLPPEAKPPLQVKPPFDTTFFVAGVATVAATTALAIATKQKATQLIDTAKQKNAKMKWFTKLDERVCYICRPLHGREWDVGDPDIPTPGRNYSGDTHFGCRCEVLLVFV